MYSISEYGDMRVGKVLLNQYASDKLIEAIVNQGFTPVVVAGDTDVYMAVEAMELIYNPNIDVIALFIIYYKCFSGSRATMPCYSPRLAATGAHRRAQTRPRRTTLHTQKVFSDHLSILFRFKLST